MAGTQSAAGAVGAKQGKARFRKSWGPKNSARCYNFEGSNDVVGIVMLEIQGATDLPRLRNSKSPSCQSTCAGVHALCDGPCERRLLT